MRPYAHSTPDQNSRRISLLGFIDSQPAILLVERAALPSEGIDITRFLSHITSITNLGANDIYHWFMASHRPSLTTNSAAGTSPQPPDLKLNLIYPCGPQHIKKYSAQRLRMVTETPAIYARYVRPYIERTRAAGRLNWVYNILEGRTEQEDVILRSHQTSSLPSSLPSLLPTSLSSSTGGKEEEEEEGFLLLPDLNWDRRTLPSLHLLALPTRRDLHSLRSLRRRHVPWLRSMRAKILSATTQLYPQLEEDELKCYVHYQPTYYHFHVHVVHVALEAGATQAVGKAFGLGEVVEWLEGMKGGEGEEDVGLEGVEISYTLGEGAELWEEVFGPLKEGRLEA
ncbi:MAG: hypothetical protein Q9227_002670 [Pyrenula ochraceoflavens]